jgi:hypothetical protein
MNLPPLLDATEAFTITDSGFLILGFSFFLK